MSSPYVVLITGANSGIGYETAKALLQSTKRHYHIIFSARDAAKGQDALKQLEDEVKDHTHELSFLECDVTSDDSIKAAVKRVEASPGRLDTLVNNAGATFDIAWTQGKVNLRDTFNNAYNVNVTGAHVMSYEFMPLLLKSPDPRLLFVAGLSQMTKAAKGPYFPTPPLPAGWPKHVHFETIGYRCSKTALNMLMLDWNHKLKVDGVKVWSVGPGALATNLGGMIEKAREMGFGPPSAGGAMLRSVVEGERDADTGKVIGKDGEIPF